MTVMDEGVYPEDDALPVALAEEWQTGECDMCGGDSGQVERAAQLASALVPVCACTIGQGAPAGECLCGPELFEGNAPEGRVEQ